MINMLPEEPSMDLHSRYSLVIAVAKRARQIVAKREPGAAEVHKPVTIALQEIEQGKVRIVPKEETRGENLPPQGEAREAPQETDEPK